MNKETTFITRISGLGWLAFLKCLGGMDEDDAFTTSFVVSTICAIIGPINAELNLDCNTAHGAAWVLFPVLLASHALRDADVHLATDASSHRRALPRISTHLLVR